MTSNQTAALARLHGTCGPPHQRAFYYKATTSAHIKKVAQRCAKSFLRQAEKKAMTQVFARINEFVQPIGEPRLGPAAQASVRGVISARRGPEVVQGACTSFGQSPPAAAR